MNIHSLRNWFSDLTKLVFEHVDILIVEQTKLDTSNTTAQFWIPGCHKLFRLDVTANSGGLLVYVKRSTPTTELRAYEPLFDIQAISFEINLKKEKRFFIGVYKPPSHNSNIASVLLDFSSMHDDNKVVFEDFNMKPNNLIMLDFLNDHGFTSLMSVTPVFKKIALVLI